MPQYAVNPIAPRAARLFLLMPRRTSLLSVIWSAVSLRKLLNISGCLKARLWRREEQVNGVRDDW